MQISLYDSICMFIIFAILEIAHPFFGVPNFNPDSYGCFLKSWYMRVPNFDSDLHLNYIGGHYGDSVKDRREMRGRFLDVEWEVKMLSC